jgi:hypothetical protein
MRLTFLLAVLCLGWLGLMSLGKVTQTPGRSLIAEVQASSAESQTAQGDSPSPIFRISAREVLIDVIALHGRDKIVLDLTAGDFEVSETSAPPDQGSTDKRWRSKTRASTELETITSVHLEDPDVSEPSGDDGRGGFQIAASCLERSTQHYRLAFRPGPDGWRSGSHTVEIATTRAGVKLVYRHQYYVGLTEPPANPPVHGDIGKVLMQDACYYPETPTSISLRARFIDTGRNDLLRTSVAIDAGSLSFVTLGGDGGEASLDRHLALDYGVCEFDARGRPIDFYKAPLDQALSTVEYARVLDHGFPHVLEFPASDQVAMTRVVVMDRATGNVGAVDVAPAGPERGGATGDQASQDKHLAMHTESDLEKVMAWLDPRWAGGGKYMPMIMNPPLGPIGSFGSIVAAPNAFCGDVYELSNSSPALPDFRELDPIGSLYAPTLDVPDQNFENTSGIPGVTPRTNLFGIDYHGAFWVENPGEYQFLMVSDDGAILRVDDKKVIDLDGLHQARGQPGEIHLEPGRHTIEVPYYQGAVNAVALELWVKTPGAGSWALFDMKDFSGPASNAVDEHPRSH